ncbi:MAG: T9SS type A sorting domain-containing protein, partial [Candidatus Zixiibacteriota bacterium]
YTKWLAPAGAGIYVITNCVTDECGLVACCPDTFEVVPIIDQVDIAETECVDPGSYVDVPIYLHNNTNPFGGFELEVEFDYTSMTFVGADMGDLLTGLYDASEPPVIISWEYFNYRLLPCPSCGCCKYKILLLGMNDLPNGSNNVGACIPTGSDGELVVLHFVVNNDEKLRGFMIPVCFEWEGTVVNDLLVEDWDCAENTFSSCDGNILYTSKMLCQYAPGLCDPPTGGIVSNMTFQTDVCGLNCGGVLVCGGTNEVCKRGDVNYNTLAYEVADAVLFARYFAEGLGVFTDPSYQICATDVNADGRALTLSDLVYLIRVILHDAVEIPKLAPSTIANVIVYNGTITVEGANVGAILFEFDSAVNPTLLAANMEMINKDTKVLVWSRTGNSIENAAEVLSYTGDAKLTSVTAVDRDTRVLTTTITAKVAPSTFALHAAYPNPFNPFTNLSFTLPEAVNYSLKIYNVAGQLVRAYEGTGSTGLNVITWDGKDNAGNSVSSGVYFYKLIAGTFSATEKMVMMK